MSRDTSAGRLGGLLLRFRFLELGRSRLPLGGLGGAPRGLVKLHEALKPRHPASGGLSGGCHRRFSAVDTASRYGSAVMATRNGAALVIFEAKSRLSMATSGRGFSQVNRQS